MLGSDEDFRYWTERFNVTRVAPLLREKEEKGERFN